ncbi:MAG: hypothetical protein Tsb0013_13010 [Phycisphaerales bacterium]
MNQPVADGRDTASSERPLTSTHALLSGLIVLAVVVGIVHTVPHAHIRAVGGGVALVLMLSALCGFAAPLIAPFAGVAWLARRRWGVLIALVLGVGWGTLWHTTLGPHPRNIDRMQRLHTALEAHRAAGRSTPKPDDLVDALDITGSDPHNLRSMYDASTGHLLDAYARPIDYRRGVGGTFLITSLGADGVRTVPGPGAPSPNDDIVLGDPLFVEITGVVPDAWRDAARDFVRGRAPGGGAGP